MQWRPAFPACRAGAGGNLAASGDITIREECPLRSVLLVLLAAIGAFVPWFAFFLALRAVSRRFRPRRIVRSRRLPVTRPGDPLGAAALLVLLLAAFVPWGVFTRPLWQGYVRDATDSRGN